MGYLFAAILVVILIVFAVWGIRKRSSTMMEIGSTAERASSEGIDGSKKRIEKFLDDFPVVLERFVKRLEEIAAVYLERFPKVLERLEAWAAEKLRLLKDYLGRVFRLLWRAFILLGKIILFYLPTVGLWAFAWPFGSSFLFVLGLLWFVFVTATVFYLPRQASDKYEKPPLE